MMMHIWHSNLRQITKLCSIIPKFDEAMPYYAHSSSEFLHFQLHVHCNDLSKNGRQIQQILIT